MINSIDDLILDQEVKDQIDSIIVQCVLSDYKVEYSASDLDFNIILTTPNNVRQYEIILNATYNKIVYGIWIQSKNRLLRCSSNDPEIVDLLFPLKVLQLLL